MVLTAKKIDHVHMDVAASEEAKVHMRQIVGDPNALQRRPVLWRESLPPCLCCIHNAPPQNFDAFEQALEEECLEAFLNIQ